MIIIGIHVIAYDTTAVANSTFCIYASPLGLWWGNILKSERITLCAFGLHWISYIYVSIFYKVFILGAMGRKVGKMPKFWGTLSGVFPYYFIKKNKSLHMLGVKPIVSTSFWTRVTLSFTPMMSEALTFNCFAPLLKDTYISQNCIRYNFSSWLL